MLVILLGVFLLDVVAFFFFLIWWWGVVCLVWFSFYF